MTTRSEYPAATTPADAAPPVSPGRPHPSPLGRSAARGFIWQTGATIAIKAISVISNLILAKLLAQDDFGAVALAYSITFLGGTLANAGVSDVLIQRQARLHLWLNPGFWMSLTSGVAGAVITLLLAPVAAIVFRDMRLVGLIAVIAIGIPIQNLGTIADTVLMSSLRFRLVASVTLVGALAQTALTLIFAVCGFKAYSFVLPQPIVALLIGAAKWWIAAPRVKFDFQIRRWRYLIGDTTAVFIVRLLGTILGQADYMTLGLMYPKPVVGAYYLAFNLAVQVARLAIGNFNSVLYPTLSRLHGEPQRQVEATLRTARMIVALGIPLFFMQAAAAAPAEQLLFAGKWRDAVPVMQILSIAIAITSAGWVTESFFRSLGEFRFYLKFYSIATPIVLLAIAVGASTGKAVGTALAISGSWALLHLVGFGIALRRQGIPLTRMFRIYLVPLPAAAITTAIALAVDFLLAPPPIVSIAVTVTVIGAGYSLILWCFAPDVLAELRLRLLHR